MRIAIITESFPPDVNGVANCVVRVAENLVRKGHHPLVIAPESAHDAAARAAWSRRLAGTMPVPMVAVYQTDLPNYARAYHLGRPTVAFAWRWLRDIHNTAGRTLAPSSVTAADLRAHGLERVELWGRGVDAERFHPARRDEELRAEIAPGGV